MHDINFIRENPEKVIKGLIKRGVDLDLTNLLELDRQRRARIFEVEGLKSRKNQISSEISALIKEKKSTDQHIGEMKDLSLRIKALDSKLAGIEKEMSEFMDGLPNLPDEDVPPGGKENNEVLHQWGQKPVFDFPHPGPCNPG